jgi:hypothetical protein
MSGFSMADIPGVYYSIRSQISDGLGLAKSTVLDFGRKLVLCVFEGDTYLIFLYLESAVFTKGLYTCFQPKERKLGTKLITKI